jgi:hypothetical protein
MAPNGRIISEYCNGKDLEGRDCDLTKLISGKFV